uniref:Uncharacterized protein n=1 Tax=Anguilla anguilla TaxID=7936 RepID=A0A0E9TQV6_ANGAN
MLLLIKCMYVQHNFYNIKTGIKVFGPLFHCFLAV